MNKRYSINEKLTRNAKVGGFTIISDNNDHAKRPLGNWQSDNAWDLKAPIGTSVYSYTKGTVAKINESGKKNPKIFGTQVTITGEDGYPNIFYTHLDSVTLTKGTKVNVGDFIGKITRWPSNPEGSHVHIGLQTGDLGDIISRNPNVNPNLNTDSNPGSKHYDSNNTNGKYTNNGYVEPDDYYGGSEMFQDMMSSGLGLDKLSQKFVNTPLNEVANGMIPDNQLTYVNLPTGGVSKIVKLNTQAAKDFNAMVKAAYDEKQIKITASQGYRPLGSKEEGCGRGFTQWCAWIKFKSGKGNLAAEPGNSNHGEGAAVDVENCRKGSPVHTWLTNNAARFNFYPLKSEAWHWDHISGKGKNFVPPSPVINNSGPRADNTSTNHNNSNNSNNVYIEPDEYYGGSEMFQDMMSSGLGLDKLSQKFVNTPLNESSGGYIKFENPCPNGEMIDSPFLSKNKLKIKTTKGLEVISPYDGVVVTSKSDFVIIEHNIKGKKWTSEISNFISYTGTNQKVRKGSVIGVSEDGTLKYEVNPSVDALKLITVGIDLSGSAFSMSNDISDDDGDRNPKTKVDVENDIYSDIMKSFLSPIDFVKGSLLPDKPSKINEQLESEIRKIKRLL